MGDLTAFLVAVYCGVGVILAAGLLSNVTVPDDADIGYRTRRLFLAVAVAALWPGALAALLLWRSRYRHIVARFIFGKPRDDEDHRE